MVILQPHWEIYALEAAERYAAVRHCTASISTVTRKTTRDLPHGRVDGHVQHEHIPSRRQQIDNQGERHPIFTFKSLRCRQGRPPVIPCPAPAGPSLGMRSLRHGRRRHARLLNASLHPGSRLLRLVPI